jgi:hypothetical protein
MENIQENKLCCGIFLSEMQIEGIKNLPKINHFSLRHYKGVISGDTLYEDDHILIKIKGDNIIFWYDDKIDGHVCRFAFHKDIIGKIVSSMVGVK